MGKRITSVTLVLVLLLSLSTCFAENSSPLRLGGGDSHYVIDEKMADGSITKAECKRIADSYYSAYYDDQNNAAVYLAFDLTTQVFGLKAPRVNNLVDLWKASTGLNKYFFEADARFYLGCFNRMDTKNLTSLKIVQKHVMYEWTNGGYVPVQGPRINQ